MNEVDYLQSYRKIVDGYEKSLMSYMDSFRGSMAKQMSEMLEQIKKEKQVVDERVSFLNRGTKEEEAMTSLDLSTLMKQVGELVKAVEELKKKFERQNESGAEKQG